MHNIICKKIFFFITVAIVLFGLCGSNVVLAQTGDGTYTPPVATFTDTATQYYTFLDWAGYNSEHLKTTGSEVYQFVIAYIINIVLMLLGIFFLVTIFYGGFVWMTAGGNEDRAETGKMVIINAVVGVAVVLGAYIFVFSLFNYFIGIAQEKTPYYGYLNDEFYNEDGTPKVWDDDVPEGGFYDPNKVNP